MSRIVRLILQIRIFCGIVFHRFVSKPTFKRASLRAKIELVWWPRAAWKLAGHTIEWWEEEARMEGL